MSELLEVSSLLGIDLGSKLFDFFLDLILCRAQKSR
jgi:hypothetical protein